MEYRFLGRTGLQVSVLGLGTMTWARDTDQYEATDQFNSFVGSGGTLIDTAESYAWGQAQTLLGELIAAHGERDELVLCAKSGAVRRGDNIRHSLARGDLLASLNTTLQQLGTDYLDIWMLQGADQVTGVEESVSALVHALNSGKTRYVGLSNFPAWQVGQISQILQVEGYELATVSHEYSLLNRSAEADIFHACHGLGIGFIGWSGLGRGVLTGKYLHSIPPDSRAASAHLSGFVEPYLNAECAGIINGLQVAANNLSMSPSQLALAWGLSRPEVSSLLLGSRTGVQLETILRDFNPGIASEIVTVLSEVSQTRTIQFPSVS